MSSIPSRRSLPAPVPALCRLAALAPLGATGTAALEAALSQAVDIPARRELILEGSHPGEPRIIVKGWAARVRMQVDGSRQFLSLLLPGDLIALFGQPDPVATSTVVALTALKVCPAPSCDRLPSLASAYAMSKAIEDAYLLDQIGRLGRLRAQGRLLHLLLELNERLSLAGLAQNGSFEMPLTQEQMADALGLTAVHVNRMLKQARRECGLVWDGRRVSIADPVQLGVRIGRAPVRVSGGRRQELSTP